MSFTIHQALISTDQGYTTVDVQVEGDRITAIAPSLKTSGLPIDGRNKLLLPGFVNAHTHSSELWQRGAIPPFPLELWLAELYDFTPLDPGKIYLSAVGTAIETLMSGGTTVVDHLVLIPGQEYETVAEAIRGYRQVGIRAYVGPLIQDEPLPASVPSGGMTHAYDPYFRDAAEALALMETLIRDFHRPDEGISIMAAPTGFQLCSDDLIQGCVELSDRYTLCRHMHLLETKAQQMLAYEKYGCSAVEHLHRLGFLGPKTSLAHGVWIDDPDIALLAASGSTVVHNPLSNLRLGSGIAPILKYRQAGVNVTFGCDGASSNDSQDLLEAIKIGTIIHNTTDFDYRAWVTPREAIDMAALGGATGLGMADQFGSLEVGKRADLVLYDLTHLSLLPRTDPISLLVLGRPHQVVKHAWVNGRMVVVDGVVNTVDVEQLRASLFERSTWTSDRRSSTRQELEPHYRSVMGLDE